MPLASPSVTGTTTATATASQVRGHPDRYVSSPDGEVSVWEAGFGPEGREQTRVPQAGSTAPQGPGLASELSGILDVLGIRRYLSPESYAITDVSSLWADIEADPAVEAQSSRLWGSGAGCCRPSPGDQEPTIPQDWKGSSSHRECWTVLGLSPTSSCKRSSFYLWGWRAVAKLVASCSASTRASSAPCFAPSLPQSHSSC
ncbi:uncharacterized protein LOC129564377 isoform X2 [Moschus berezovskii]|uniref:uncharacterized protein LOC129564377 isoform X2 n=1 Tax=Moschus berezovskii TaxID=68408 RepID=UPI002444B6FF|nr:uncharacterized protein LOC129564377 isoform X2 [Moschus berezovskii]